MQRNGRRCKIAGTLPVTAYGTVGPVSPVTDGFGTLQVASFSALAMLDAGFVDMRNGVVTIDGVSGSADGDAVTCAADTSAAARVPAVICDCEEAAGGALLLLDPAP